MISGVSHTTQTLGFVFAASLLGHFYTRLVPGSVFSACPEADLSPGSGGVELSAVLCILVGLPLHAAADTHTHRLESKSTDNVCACMYKYV